MLFSGAKHLPLASLNDVPFDPQLVLPLPPYFVAADLLGNIQLIDATGASQTCCLSAIEGLHHVVAAEVLAHQSLLLLSISGDLFRVAIEGEDASSLPSSYGSIPYSPRVRNATLMKLCQK